MSRPSAFDDDAVLEAATDQVWRHGYAAPSVRDLGQAMGLVPASLYNAFGSKHALFTRGLERYLDSGMGERSARLEASMPPRTAIEAFLNEIVSRSLDDPRGCLLVNSMLELAPHAAEIGAVVATRRAEVEGYRREAERHYQVLEDHLAGRDFIVGDGYTIADMSAWGWIDRAARVMKGEADPLAGFPNIKRWFQAIDARPAVAPARAVGHDHAFKKDADEQTRRALFPSNYPPA